jgi:hypothetical protein
MIGDVEKELDKAVKGLKEVVDFNKMILPEEKDGDEKKEGEEKKR